MPFIKTATLGGSGAAVLPASDVLNHVGMVRVRATGAGNLLGVLSSLDDIVSDNLAVLAIPTASAAPLQSLANFTQERISLKLYTNEIDEIFSITRIIFYVKPLYTQRPG